MSEIRLNQDDVVLIEGTNSNLDNTVGVVQGIASFFPLSYIVNVNKNRKRELYKKNNYAYTHTVVASGNLKKI